MTGNLRRAARALLSVSDKDGLVEFARALAGLGIETVSTGGTRKTLANAGLKVVDVSELTGFPEMMDGRVKTLHPKVHGGLLAIRDDKAHAAAMATHGISAIDILVVNLYPFEATVAKGAGYADCIENIDIGGPAMIRAAAKNHAHVGVLVDPEQYGPALAELQAGDGLSTATRRALARVSFERTAAYDAEIAGWLREGDTQTAADAAAPRLPANLDLRLERAQELRYGENPHQHAARYRLTGRRSWWDDAVQHGGKELSYLNLYDTEAAWRLVQRFDDPAVVIVKHANPCGVAVGADITAAYIAANGCDPVSAFGGIVAANRPVPVALAEALAPVFTEVVVAPSFDADALAVLTAKKNLRVLTAPPPNGAELDLRSIDGGLLAQSVDRVSIDRRGWRVVTVAQPDEEAWQDAVFAWQVCAAVSSNAIVLTRSGKAVGIGAGQQNRLDSARIAAAKAAGRAAGGSCASDAFFPFRDGLDAVVEAGIRTVIQPGGSMRDDEVIAAADEHGIAMVFTGERHFRH
jgi:phosphoribosylaminoimidazolecarboxamide formyltransferase/IMP cyclohydrolase